MNRFNYKETSEFLSLVFRWWKTGIFSVICPLPHPGWKAACLSVCDESGSSWSVSERCKLLFNLITSCFIRKVVPTFSTLSLSLSLFLSHTHTHTHTYMYMMMLEGMCGVGYYIVHWKRWKKTSMHAQAIKLREKPDIYHPRKHTHTHRQHTL